MPVPTISVIIPTYNRANCIRDAVNSVLAQSYTDYEIIVVDDGSTDSTDEVLKAYGGRIIYAYQENAGVSAARNRGIKEARGGWIAFLDSDDEWLPEKLSRQMECLEKNPDVCGAVCDVEIVSGTRTERLFAIRNYQTGAQICLREERPLAAVLNANFCTPTWLFRKDALKNAGSFNESLSLYEDIDFSARVALQGPWIVIPDPLVKVMHKSTDNLSVQHVNDPTRTPRNLILIYEGLLKLASLDHHESGILKARLADQYFSLGYEILKRGGNKSPHGYLWRSVLTGPPLKGFVKVAALYAFGPRFYGAIARRRHAHRPGFRRSEVEMNAAED